MGDGTDIYCPICFAMPGEPCIEKYVIWGGVNVTPVITGAPHGARLVDSDRAQFFMSRKAPQSCDWFC